MTLPLGFLSELDTLDTISLVPLCSLRSAQTSRALATSPRRWTPSSFSACSIRFLNHLWVAHTGLQFPPVPTSPCSPSQPARVYSLSSVLNFLAYLRLSHLPTHNCPFKKTERELRMVHREGGMHRLLCRWFGCEIQREAGTVSGPLSLNLELSRLATSRFSRVPILTRNEPGDFDRDALISLGSEQRKIGCAGRASVQEFFT